MPFDERLARRVRSRLRGEHSFKEKKMFGGLAFMVNGHMCCGIVGEDLVVRTGVGTYHEALAQPHARPMDFTGRPLKGMVYVAPEGIRSDAALARWVRRGLAFVSEKAPSKIRKRASPTSPSRRHLV